ncbi:MAG TPA: DinB family protein [Chitinophaga sp.]|uniref:DinB family protein n=1 Tax=Chitinophaga sp. TaxID=1869181 RepID=UPI002B91295D|nr:DinB family protein [Chitinophaga sp.]HVI45719.1 DinB family protein [Chitinophaga sp.]
MIHEMITTNTTIASLMKNYANYNSWANSRLVEWLRSKPAHVLEQEVPSSFNTIKQTVLHILQAQCYWLCMIKRQSFDTVTDFNCSLEEAFAGIVEQSAAMADYVNNMTAEHIEEVTSIVSPWFRSDFENFEYILHCMNHSTYHRGQIVTMAHNLGVTEAPMTDYNYYNVNAR